MKKKNTLLYLPAAGRAAAVSGPPDMPTKHESDWANGL